MEFGSIFVLSFITALSGALMPGPLLTVTIAQTARKGFMASLLLILGHSLLELLVVVGLWFGLGHFLKMKPVLGTVTVVGGAMLIWMGFGMIREAWRGALDIGATDGNAAMAEGVLRNPLITGMAVSISNPYWTIWWATIGLSFFAALSQSALTTILAFYLGHIMGDILWYSAVGGAVATGRRVMNPKAYRVVVQACGVFLIFLGISFAYLMISGSLWEIKMSADLLRSGR